MYVYMYNYNVCLYTQALSKISEDTEIHLDDATREVLENWRKNTEVEDRIGDDAAPTKSEKPTELNEGL